MFSAVMTDHLPQHPQHPQWNRVPDDTRCVCEKVFAAPEVLEAQVRVQRAQETRQTVEGWLRDMPGGWPQRALWPAQLPSVQTEVADSEEPLGELIQALADFERAELRRARWS